MIFFSSKSFIKNPNGWSDSLRLNYFKNPAKLLPMEWVDSIKPKPPVLTYKDGFQNEKTFLIRIKKADIPDSIKLIGIYLVPERGNVYKDRILYKLIPVSDFELTGKKEGILSNKYILLSFIRYNNTESDLSLLYWHDC